MDSAISSFCESMASFCNHVETSSSSLSAAIQRRPLPLDSAASAFLQCLDRRVESTAADLALLDSMAFATVSFEELLGHCNEVVKINDKYIRDVEERMMEFGYVGEVEDEVDDGSSFDGLDEILGDCGSVSVSGMKLDEDLLIEDSISIQSIGLSDACLSTLASEGRANGASIVIQQPPVYASYATDSIKKTLTAEFTERSLIKASKNDYDSLPSSIKCLASWEELQEAIVKMNSYLSGKGNAKDFVAFNQEEVEKMGLGRKGRACVLILLRINKLVVDTIDGTVFYRLVD